MTKRLTLSDLQILGPAQTNPNGPQAMQISEQYCKSLGILHENFANYASMSTYVFPRASLERLVTVDLLNNLLFFIDDTLGEEQAATSQPEKEALFHTCMLILRDGYHPAQTNPILETCKVLRPQIQRFASPALQS